MPPGSAPASAPAAATSGTNESETGVAASEAPSGSVAGQSPNTTSRSPAGKATEAQGNSTLQPENFWQSFQFYCKQNGKNIPSKSIRDKPIYSTATKGTPSVLDGANVWIEFDAKDVASDEITIEVVGPDGKTTSATFDLKKLR
jgi:hypothetical protein